MFQLAGDLAGRVVLECPACESWQLDHPHDWLDLGEVEDLAKAHLLECFGVPT